MSRSPPATAEGGAPPECQDRPRVAHVRRGGRQPRPSVANVALPSIGASYNRCQTTLDLIAVGYSLRPGCFRPLVRRHGRPIRAEDDDRPGDLITIPASLVAGFAPSDTVLFGARVVGGLAAGMAYPTTLALITALWSGPARTRSIAMWSALGGGVAMLGPLVSGFLLERFAWGTVFLVTIPWPCSRCSWPAATYPLT